MCVVSMIADHYYDRWKPYRTDPPTQWPNTFPPAPTPTRIPSQAEIDEFHELLRKAREYDKRNNEPDCELEEKKKRLNDLAKELGVKIEFA